MILIVNHVKYRTVPAPRPDYCEGCDARLTPICDKLCRQVEATAEIDLCPPKSVFKKVAP